MSPLCHHERPAAKAPAPYVESDDDSVGGEYMNSFSGYESLYGDDMYAQSDDKSNYGEVAHTPTSSNNTTQFSKLAEKAGVEVSKWSLEHIMNATDRCITFRSEFAPGSSAFGYFTQYLHELQDEYNQVLKDRIDRDFSNDTHIPDESKSHGSQNLVDQPLSSRDNDNAPSKKWSTVKFVSDWVSPPHGYYDGEAVTYTVNADTKKPRTVDGAPKTGLTPCKEEQATLELLKPPFSINWPTGDPIKFSKSAEQITATETGEYNQDKDVKRGNQQGSLPSTSFKQSPVVEPKASSPLGRWAVASRGICNWPVPSSAGSDSPLSEASVPSIKSPKPTNCTVTYWATIEHGDQTAHIPIDSSNVTGSEKTIIEGTAGMKKVWTWVQEKGLVGKVSLQDAFELAKDMHSETKVEEPGKQDRDGGIWLPTQSDAGSGTSYRTVSSEWLGLRSPALPKASK